MANTGDTLQFFTNLGSIIQKDKESESNKKNSSQSFLDPFFDNGVNKKFMKYTKKQPKSYKIKDDESSGSSEEQDSNEESNEDPADLKKSSGDFKRSNWDEELEDRATKEEVEGQFDDMGSESSDDDNSGDDDSDVSDEDGSGSDDEGNRKRKRRRDDDEDEDEQEDEQEDRKIVFPKNRKPKTQEEIQQLKDKLKQLIEDKRKSRQGKNYVPTEEAPKKDRTEEKKEKKKKKKQQKKRNQSTKEKKEGKKEGEEKDEKKKDPVFNVLKKSSDAKPSLDEGNDMEFGTLKVDEDGEIKPSYLIKQMEKKGKGKKSKLVKSIKLAEAEKKLIDELKEKEGGQEIVLQKSRERTLALVRGEKLRDDPTLLKKSLKNLKSQKKKSYTKIVKNKEAQKRSMEERQKRRDDNIAARNKIKSDYRKGVIKHKEMKKLTKEQRKRKSGFEGSKKKKKQKK